MKKQHLKNGLFPNSTRNLNISLTAAGTPSSNGAFSHSIQDFTRILLQVEYPHLAARNTHHISFAWDQSPSSPYNDWLTSLVLKHGTFSKNNDLLSRYHFSPTDDTSENTQRVIFHWIHGRQREFRLSSRAPDLRQAQAVHELKSKRKALQTLSGYMCCLVPPAEICQIFMDPACTSDTEEDGHGKLLYTHLSWKSQEFTNFAHNLDVATIERLREEKGARY
ncbi:hypothetical protein VP01_9231g1, partial [Puccinia sorghi]